MGDMEGGTGVSERVVEADMVTASEDDVDEVVVDVDWRSSSCLAMISRQLPPFLLVAPLT